LTITALNKLVYLGYMTFYSSVGSFILSISLGMVSGCHKISNVKAIKNQVIEFLK